MFNTEKTSSLLSYVMFHLINKRKNISPCFLIVNSELFDILSRSREITNDQQKLSQCVKWLIYHSKQYERVHLPPFKHPVLYVVMTSQNIWKKRSFGVSTTFFSSCKALTLPFASTLSNLLVKICSAYCSTWPISSLLKYSITGTMRRISLVFFFAASGYIQTAQWEQKIFFLFAANIYLYWYFVFTQVISFSGLNLHAPCFSHCV